MKRLGILGSTRGTHLSTIIAACEAKTIAAEVAVVISNKATAPILERASAQHIAAQFIDPAGRSREDYDAMVSDVLAMQRVDLIVLVGYMRILSAAFVTRWAERIINVHPSLLPAFAGMMDMDVHRAVIAAGHPVTGCTVHWVTAEVDAGPIVLQKTCPVLPSDDAACLKRRVQALEGEALVQAISQLVNG